MATPPDNSGTSSVVDHAADVEKTQLDAVNLRGDSGAPKEYVRPISTTSWILVCIGIYLGAILYGTYDIHSSVQIMLIMLLQVSTRQLRQTSKGLFLSPLGRLKNCLGLVSASLWGVSL
jgi:hypothetical protein